jgi:hypothetical protein
VPFTAAIARTFFEPARLSTISQLSRSPSRKLLRPCRPICLSGLDCALPVKFTHVYVQQPDAKELLTRK